MLCLRWAALLRLRHEFPFRTGNYTQECSVPEQTGINGAPATGHHHLHRVRRTKRTLSMACAWHRVNGFGLRYCLECVQHHPLGASDGSGRGSGSHNPRLYRSCMGPLEARSRGGEPEAEDASRAVAW